MLGHGFDSRRLHLDEGNTPQKCRYEAIHSTFCGVFFCRCADFLVCLTDWVDCRVFGSPRYADNRQFVSVSGVRITVLV